MNLATESISTDENIFTWYNPQKCSIEKQYYKRYWSQRALRVYIKLGFTLLAYFTSACTSSETW